MDFEQSLAKFKQIRGTLETLQAVELSEADTRVKIIDRLLREVFGWDETACVQRERHVNFGDGSQGFIDYVCRSNNNDLIIEAKRTGTYFTMPKGRQRKVRLKSLRTKASDLGDALLQVSGYCREEFISVGVVSNGLQLAVTYVPYQTRGSSYDTLLFDGPDDIEENFVDLYNILSPGHSASPIVEHLLSGRGDVRPAPPVRKRVVAELPEQGADRNPIDSFLQPLTQEFFTDLQDESLLSECFVVAGRQTRYQAQLERLLTDQMPRVGKPVTSLSSDRGDSEFKSDYEVAQGFKTGVVFLLLGGVGVGKTSFLRHFFTRMVGETQRRKTVWMHVDCTRASDETINLEEFIVRELYGQLLANYGDLELTSWDNLQKVYGDEINRFRTGVWAPVFKRSPDDFDLKVSDWLTEQTKDLKSHVASLLKYCREKLKMPTCMVIDNADQLGVDIQRRVVMLAFGLAKTLGGTVLLALREETYWRLKSVGPFDAYSNRVYHITPPKVADVLEKRFEAIKNRRGSETVNLVTRQGVKVSGVSVASFCDAVVRSLRYKSTSDVDPPSMLMFEALAAGNVRHALELFRTFLLSGHTNTDEYLRVIMDQGKYTIPERAFFVSVALGERKHYSSERSHILNLFSLEDDGFWSHFAKLRILDYLSSRSGVESQAGIGYVKVRNIYEQLSEIFRDEEALRQTLTPLLRYLLVEADNGSRLSGLEADFVRLTSAGWYYLTTLSSKFHYLNLVCIDTPITDSEFHFKLRQLTDATLRGDKVSRLRARLDRVEVFLQYLSSCEEKEEAYIPTVSQMAFGSRWARMRLESWPREAEDIWRIGQQRLADSAELEP